MNVNALKLASHRKIGSRKFDVTAFENGNILSANTKGVRFPASCDKMNAYLLPRLPHYWSSRDQVKAEIRAFLSKAA